MNEAEKIEDNVINCMLSMQRYPWEQGVCAQALYEAGQDELWIPMAYDAVKRMHKDGRLAMIGGEVTVSDPAANGEVCLRAFEKTGDTFFKEGADRMLKYLLEEAPRTEDGIICHNTVSFEDGYSPYQLWIDGLYMVPPFLSVMGYLEEAMEHVRGYCRYLYDNETHLFYHIFDAEQGRFVRKIHWATGNGWALMGLARILEEAMQQGREDLSNELLILLTDTLKSMLSYQCPDGRFRDILDDNDSFIDGTSAMMTASVIYRGNTKGYLNFGSECADRAYETVTEKIDDYGLIHEVCGCPDFLTIGTSAEAQASYIMASAWKSRLYHMKKIPERS